MSATERLRELLDERGVEWTSWDTKVSRNIRTDFCPDAGVSMSVWENDGKLGIDAHTLYRFTPEQAIAATLGAGTCHISVKDNLAETDGMGDVWLECDACGWQMPLEPSTPRFHFCPNCGRKVVDE